MSQSPAGNGQLQDQVIIITGAARGIGLACAEEFAREGAHVIAGARAESIAELRGNATPHLYPTELDVSNTEQIRAVVSDTLAHWGRVDAVINNAAVSIRSLVSDLTDEDVDENIRTNFLGALNLIRAVLPSMKARASGRIINVSSVGGMMAMPTMGMYSVGSSRVDLQACKLEYSIVSPK